MTDNDKPDDQLNAEIRWQEEIRRADDVRYDKLEARVKKLETKGRILESISDERLYLIIFAAYVFFAYILPALRSQDTGSNVQPL